MNLTKNSSQQNSNKEINGIKEVPSQKGPFEFVTSDSNKNSVSSKPEVTSKNLNSNRKIKNKKTLWIPVVAGLIKKGPLVLVGQRPENNSLAGQWEFPGGKIESGETPEVALARELKEELDIDATVGELKFATTHSFGDLNILLLFYEILYWKGEPKAMHHLMIEWIPPENLLQRAIPDANRRIIDKIFKALGVTSWPK